MIFAIYTFEVSYVLKILPQFYDIQILKIKVWFYLFRSWRYWNRVNLVNILKVDEWSRVRLQRFMHVAHFIEIKLFWGMYR